MNIFDLQDKYKEREFSVVEIVSDYLKRIKEVDNRIKAFVTVDELGAIERAKELDKVDRIDFDKMPLYGVPIAIKDNFSTKDLKTTASAKILEDYRPVFDSTVVERLKKAGAVILGKTNMDAWAHGSSTETSDFFTTRNPWDLSRLPGGSSGGSAAAVAAKMCMASIGSETAGSIRQPASWCGVVGTKPTYGRVSRYGVVAMASSTDSPGPITNNIIDSTLILRVIAGKDNHDSTCSALEVEDYMKGLEDGVEGMKIGVIKEYFLEDMNEEIKEKVKKAIEVFEKAGAQIVEVELMDPKYAVAVYTIVQRSEVSSNLARYDGVRYGKGRKYFGSEAKRRIMIGTHVLSSGYYDQYYLKAQKVRRLIIDDFRRVFEKVDLLLAPTTPCCALKVGSTADQPMFGEMMDILVEASSLAGLPGISMNCGFSKEGLPIGLQIMADQFEEDKCLQAGKFYENERNIVSLEPDL